MLCVQELFPATHIRVPRASVPCSLPERESHGSDLLGSAARAQRRARLDERRLRGAKRSRSRAEGLKSAYGGFGIRWRGHGRRRPGRRTEAEIAHSRAGRKGHRGVARRLDPAGADRPSRSAAPVARRGILAHLEGKLRHRRRSLLRDLRLRDHPIAVRRIRTRRSAIGARFARPLLDKKGVSPASGRDPDDRDDFGGCRCVRNDRPVRPPGGNQIRPRGRRSPLWRMCSTAGASCKSPKAGRSLISRISGAFRSRSSSIWSGRSFYSPAWLAKDV